MPCPPDRPITGESSVSAYGAGSTAAVAAAVAAVPGAATEAARAACNCPASCPIAAPFGIKYTVTTTDYTYFSGFGILVDVLTLGTIALGENGGFYCKATASFSWIATAHCAERAEQAYYEVASPKER